MIKEKTQGEVSSQGSQLLEERPFAYGMHIYKFVWIFLIGCVAGYVVEMLWGYVQMGHFESRQGLIYGPFSPVYGFGAVLFTLLMWWLRKASGVTIFVISAVGGALFEFFCSFFQEVVFGTLSWEYSHSPFNLAGRTNLKYAVYWGILGFVFIRHTLPWVSRQIEKIPKKVGVPLTNVVIVLLALDILLSAAAVKQWSNRQQHAAESGVISTFLDTHYPDERMEKIYPNMKLAEDHREESEKKKAESESKESASHAQTKGND
ncbi:putative ABC transporter permease [Zongyangia hominis]|uniref:putative ABC transporter permease n=1 Tax=Zongyangia hominis TaxID=2763677 RepID=UPI0021CC6ED6|nr:putative ABC transporter permease [Zongyangia hominis]